MLEVDWAVVQTNMKSILLLVWGMLLLSSVAMAAGEKERGHEKEKVTPPTHKEVQATREHGRYLAVINMANGKNIEVVLEGAEMPYTVTNFVKLARAKFYDGLTFHRVNPDFDIQGGDPKGDGTGGPGYQINLEISPLLRHKKGAISMARAKTNPDSAGCQFFITLADAPSLDGQYAVFGWIKSGMDVVSAVKKGDVIKTVTIHSYHGQEKCPVMSCH